MRYRNVQIKDFIEICIEKEIRKNTCQKVKIATLSPVSIGQGPHVEQVAPKNPQCDNYEVEWPVIWLSKVPSTYNKK